MSPSSATFAMGCFWSPDLLFEKVPGVLATEVGYTNGHTLNPTYEQICGHGTGHAEAVKVTFDPAKVSYQALLKVFWDNHNPTTLNRQGPDVGDQYRSAIFTHDAEQLTLAQASKAAVTATGKWAPKPIVTVIEPAQTWYKAEEYHQDYLKKSGRDSCHF